MGIQKELDFIYCGGLGVGFGAAAACGVALRGGVGEAGGEDLLGVGVGGELLLRPLDGYLLGEATLGELVAYSHDVLVVTAGGKLDVGFRQLRGYEGVVVGLDAAHLLVLLALFGVGGGFLGDFFHGEGDGFGFGTKENFGVVGKSTQASDVLALGIGLDAEKSLVIGVTSEEGLLVEGRVKSEERSILLLFCLRLYFLWQFILVDDSQAIAANRGVAHQRMRVGDDLRLQIREIREIRVRLKDMVEIHEAQPCETLDVLLSLSSLENTSHGEELAFGLECLAACLAIGGGERLQFLIGADEVGYSFKQARKRKLGGHVFENTDVHLFQCLMLSVQCLINSVCKSIKIRMKLVPLRNRVQMPVFIGVCDMFGWGIFQINHY